MIVVAIIGILAAIAIPLYANLQGRARIAKAQADVRTVASAISIYAAHTGGLPTAANLTTALTTPSTVGGVTAALHQVLPHPQRRRMAGQLTVGAGRRGPGGFFRVPRRRRWAFA
jgi:Tfp pilus assembly protein PilE